MILTIAKCNGELRHFAGALCFQRLSQPPAYGSAAACAALPYAEVNYGARKAPHTA